LARHLGAEVTGVCGPRNVALVRTLGAHHVIDYSTVDFTRSGQRYDVIFDTVGASSFRASRAALTPTGIYLPTTGLVTNHLLMLATALRPGRRVVAGMSVEKSAALVFVAGLLTAGRLTVVVDRRYRLEEIAEAHRYVDTGHKRGNVVVAVTAAGRGDSTDAVCGPAT
jgi:NADPH2:quinone reductase